MGTLKSCNAIKIQIVDGISCCFLHHLFSASLRILPKWCVKPAAHRTETIWAGTVGSPRQEWHPVTDRGSTPGAPHCEHDTEN